MGLAKLMYLANREPFTINFFGFNLAIRAAYLPIFYHPTGSDKAIISISLASCPYAGSAKTEAGRRRLLIIIIMPMNHWKVCLYKAK